MINQIEPWIDDEELKMLTEVVKDNWITEGKKTELFEDKIKELSKAKNALAVCNGTMSLFIMLKVAGVSEGDEVIVPDFTFIATANAVIMAGGKPVLVDVDSKTFNMDPAKIKEKITAKTKAIMPVHIYGQSANMDAILKIAKDNNLAVLEDAAQGVGVFFNDKHVGTFGEMGSLSFYGNKTITTAEGGVILTNDDELALRCRVMKHHGRPKKGTFVHDFVGYNFAFTDLQAAVGVAQMNKLDRIINKKQSIREKYIELLKDVPQVEFTYMDPRCKPVHWFTNILVEDPVALGDFLKENKIGTRRFFPPLHDQPCYKDMDFGEDYPNSSYAFDHGLSLPSSYALTDEEITIVCDKIKEFYNK